MKWFGYISVSILQKLDTYLEPKTIVEFTGGIKEERKILIEAIEKFIGDLNDKAAV